MASPRLPLITSLSIANDETIKSVLDALFEPSPQLHALAIPEIRQKRILVNPGLAPDLPPPPTLKQATVPDHRFSSYPALIRHVGTLMSQLAESPDTESNEELHGILGSHPRLGANKVASLQSQAEQAQLKTGGADEAEKLEALNDEYEARFPGLRYVVFVDGRSRPVIMEDMRRRIDRGDITAEEKEAIEAMVDIAIDRAGKLGAT